MDIGLTAKVFLLIKGDVGLITRVVVLIKGDVGLIASVAHLKSDPHQLMAQAPLCRGRREGW